MTRQLLTARKTIEYFIIKGNQFKFVGKTLVKFIKGLDKNYMNLL